MQESILRFYILKKYMSSRVLEISMSSRPELALPFGKDKRSGGSCCSCVSSRTSSRISLSNRKPPRLADMLVVKAQQPRSKNRGTSKISHNLALVGAIHHW